MRKSMLAFVLSLRRGNKDGRQDKVYLESQLHNGDWTACVLRLLLYVDNLTAGYVSERASRCSDVQDYCFRDDHGKVV